MLMVNRRLCVGSFRKKDRLGIALLMRARCFVILRCILKVRTRTLYCMLSMGIRVKYENLRCRDERIKSLVGFSALL